MAAAKRSVRKKKEDRIFINVPVSRETRSGLHLLKDAMGVASQEEVIERLVRIGVAISISAR